MTKGLSEKGVRYIHLTLCRDNKKKELELVLQAQTTWLCYSSQGVLCQYDRDERGFNMR